MLCMLVLARVYIVFLSRCEVGCREIACWIELNFTNLTTLLLTSNFLVFGNITEASASLFESL